MNELQEKEGYLSPVMNERSLLSFYSSYEMKEVGAVSCVSCHVLWSRFVVERMFT